MVESSNSGKDFTKMQEEQAPITRFQVKGMDCADCARSIERGVSKLEGVTDCTLNFSAATLQVQGRASREAVIARVRDLGYDVGEDAPAAAPVPQRGGVIGFVRYLLQRTDTTLALIGAGFIIPGLLLGEFHLWPAAPAALVALPSLIALAVAGFPVARSAWQSIRINHEVNMNVLMTLAAIGALFIGAYAEAGLVMVLFAIGEALEGYTMQQTRDSVRRLMEIAPQEALVLRPCIDCKEHLGQQGYHGGPCPFCGVEEQRVPVEDVLIGETIVVKPGERIALDGQVQRGESAVNQAPITGESVPVDKTVGEKVFAGSINGEGALEVQVTGLAADSTISRIIHMVEEAQERRAPVQRFVDRFAKVYTPAVVVVATLVAAIPPLFFGAPFMLPAGGEQGWLYRALEVLVIACPCALVISTPVSLISALSAAARGGVLIKGGAVLETLSKVKVIAFDKTGTLTAGKPNVVRVHAVDCRKCDSPKEICTNCGEMLALASAVEQRSEHPLARAVVAQAAQGGLAARYPAADAVKAMAGRGVAGNVNGHSVVVGSHPYFDAVVPHDREQCAEIGRLAGQGQTPLLVGVDNKYAGYITVADTVREGSRQAVDALKKLGIDALVMLTGDNEAAARTIAHDVGVTDVRANLLPENKTEAIKDLLVQHQPVAMVGDGVNDAPALATASVGIALGAGGTAQAMETADVVLMADDLRKLPFTIRLSRVAMRTIQANLSFSIGVKVLFLGLAVLGLGSMWLAVLADVGASLVVTLNGMRLLSYKDIAAS
jgi:Cd2+/Zn2+-exporting ATPase